MYDLFIFKNCQLKLKANWKRPLPWALRVQWRVGHRLTLQRNNFKKIQKNWLFCDMISLDFSLT